MYSHPILLPWLTCAIAFFLWSASPSSVMAQDRPVTRELYVPFEDLEVLLSSGPQRVFVTREEYRELLAKTKPDEEPLVPFAAEIFSAEYLLAVRDGRASLRGELWIETLRKGMQTIHLPLSGVGLLSATIDGQPASLARDDGRVTLFIEGVGRRKLELELSLPVLVDAAQQTLTFQLPYAPASRLRVEVPGNVEVKSGAAIVDRQVDMERNQTLFEMLLAREPMTIVMSLNNRSLREQSTVMASGVVFAEVTTAYERLHATMSMNVLNGATDEFRFAVDPQLEVYSVLGAELNRWSIESIDGQRQLVVKLQTPATGRVVLAMRLDRTAPVPVSSTPQAWTLPTLQPLGVAGSTSVIGLVTEDRLRVADIATDNLIPIDTGVLRAALPESMFAADASRTALNAVAAYYATTAEARLSATVRIPQGSLEASGMHTLVASNAGITSTVGLNLSSTMEELFSVDVLVSADWTIERVTFADDRVAQFERLDDRIRIKIPDGITPRSAGGDGRLVWLHAVHTPPGWLAPWQSQTLQAPTFTVVNAASQTGVIMVRAEDDLVIDPEAVANLLVLDQNEQAQRSSVAEGSLGYRYADGDWSASFSLTRKQPRLTAVAYSFFRVEPERLAIHIELAYLVEVAKTRQLQFSFPDSVPAELNIRGASLPDEQTVAVKETRSEVVDGRRVWTVELAGQHLGLVRLAIDTEQVIDSEVTDYVLPVARTLGVEYQSGVVSIEGHPELDLQVDEHPRSVDIGELVDAEYQVGKRLLGAYGYAGTEDRISINVARRPIHALPTTIVQRAEMLTLVSARGVLQTAVRYELKTKADYLEVRLPTDAVLWSVNLDRTPALPYRIATQDSIEQTTNDVVVAVPANTQLETRNLQIVFETRGDNLALRQEIDIQAPELFERERGAGSALAIPTADLVWQVMLPHGFAASRVNGAPAAAYSFDGLLQKLWDIGGSRRQTVFTDLAYRREAQSRLAPGAEAEIAMAEASTASRLDTLTFDSIASNSPVPTDPFGVTPDPFGAPSQPAAPDMPAPAMQAPTVDALAKAEQLPPPTTQAPNGPTSQAPLPAQSQLSRSQQSWALEGVRSLEIELEQRSSGERVRFANLGSQAKASLTVVQTRRFDWLGCLVGLIVVLFGIARTTWASRVRYVFIVVILALLIPVAVGWHTELQPTQLAMLVAAAFLFIFYALRSCGNWFASRLARLRHGSTVARSTTAAALLWLSFSQVGLAQNPFGDDVLQTPAKTEASTPSVVTDPNQISVMLRAALGSRATAKIPDDAIVVPYDPNDESGIVNSKKILVNYETYQRLLQQATDLEARTTPPLRDYSMAGVVYTLTLESSDSLQVAGTLLIDQYVEQDVLIPLRIGGCVLESAQLDGQAARLQLVTATENASQVDQQAKIQADDTAEPLVMLTASGKGRKELRFVLRMKLNKVGGWRSVSAQVPVAPAARVTLTARSAGTDIRIQGIADRSILETQQADEQVVFALPTDGHLSLQWRDKIQSSEVDQGLTVNSKAVFDVQEDALRLVWHADLEFRRSQRDAFTLQLPNGYLVERVEGPNVRGWATKTQGTTVLLDVDLLKAAEQRDSLTVFLSKAMEMSSDGVSVQVPQVTLPGAMLHQGKLLVRRSTLLEVATSVASGLSRTDLPADAQWFGAEVGDGPLPVLDYQGYQFSQPAIDLQLSVKLLKPQLRTEIQTLLKIAQRETLVETRLLINSSGRSVHHLQIRLPNSIDLAEPEIAGDFQWSLTEEDSTQLLNIYLAAGANGDFNVILRGAIASALAADQTTPSPIPLPNFELLGTERQSGAMVIQADPGYDVRIDALTGGETALLSSVRDWLSEPQLRLARSVVRFQDSQLSGTVQVLPRTPVVSSSWLSNVKVTDRSIEETILIAAKIQSAGIREFTFELPASLAEARIQAPLLRRKTIAANNVDGGPVSVRLELQDAIMGQLMVVVEHDRQASDAVQTVAMPTITTGSTLDRFVVLENASRDELISQPQSLRKVEAIRFAANAAVQFLNAPTSEMYSVSASQDGTDAAVPQLTYQNKRRDVVQTAGARIGLAQTLLIVDEFGGYRASQEYRVENRVEPYLEVQLPAGAQLWTVMVANEPVKPARKTGGEATDAGPSGTTANTTTTGETVRIPLIRTAEGDLDYPVVLKYGGALAPASNFSSTQFPFVRTVNINVELSQVRLYLPDRFRWFRFDGSMGRVDNESDLQAGWLAFRTRQLTELTEVLNFSKGAFSQARATNNLKQLGLALANVEGSFQASASNNQELRKQLEANSYALKQAQEVVARNEVEADRNGDTTLGNRGQVSNWFSQQDNQRSYNVVDEVGQNFVAPNEQFGEVTVPDQRQKFDDKWLEQNDLKAYATQDEAKLDALAEKKPQAGKQQQQQQQMAAEVAQLALPPQINDLFGKPADKVVDGGSKVAKDRISGNFRSQVERYNRRLEESQTAAEYSRELFGATSSRSQMPATRPMDDGGMEGMSEMQMDGMGGMGDMRGGGTGYGGPARSRAGITPDLGPFGNDTMAMLPPNPQSLRTAQQVGQVGGSNVGYLASLDVNLPARGQEFLFTTAGGQLELTAQSVEQETISRTVMAAGILFTAAVVWILYRAALRIAATRLGRIGLGSALVLIGAASLIVGLLPVYGILCVLAAFPVLLARH
ncbi:MAG: hypothetical protein R3C53_16580 [Pirellulaceae bacterium]